MFTHGDSALIIKSHHEANLMRSVRLLHCSTEETVGFGQFKTDNPLRERVWVVEGQLVLSDHFGIHYEANVGVIPEKHLMSLAGDFDDEDEDDVQRELIREMKKHLKDRKR